MAAGRSPAACARGLGWHRGKALLFSHRNAAQETWKNHPSPATWGSRLRWSLGGDSSGVGSARGGCQVDEAEPAVGAWLLPPGWGRCPLRSPHS